MKKFIIVASLLTVILTGIFIGLSVSEDRIGPAIEVMNSNVVYQKNEDMHELLKAVTATDDRDGDVTDSVMIEDILPMLDNATAKITFVAKDKSNNISKKEILIPYEGEQVSTVEVYPKLILLTQQVTLSKGSPFEPTSLIREVSAYGDTQEELLKNLTVVGEYDNNTPGNYVLLLYVTDAKGNESNKEYVWIEVK